MKRFQFSLETALIGYARSRLVDFVKRDADKPAVPVRTPGSAPTGGIFCMKRLQFSLEIALVAAGANPKLDAIIHARPQLLDFLKQDADTQVVPAQTLAALQRVASSV